MLLNIPKFVSRYNDILFEKRDYQTKRPPIVSPPGSAWPSSKLAVHWLPLMQDSNPGGGSMYHAAAA